MSIKDLKFDTSDFSGKDISSLPDRPGDSGITGQQLKERFDLIPKMVIALGGFNGLIDELGKTASNSSGASNIGVSSISGVSGSNVQTVLGELGTMAKNAKTAADTAAAQGTAAESAALRATEAAENAAEKATAAENATGAAIAAANEASQAAAAATMAITEVKDYAAEQAQSAKDYVDNVILEGGTVTSVFGRAGEVKAQAGDYTAEMVGARPDSWMPDAKDVGAIPAAEGAVTAEKLASGAVTEAKIANGAVTAAKIASGAVTPASIGAVSSLTAIDISNQNLITAVGGKSGFFRGTNVANAPSGNWYYFISVAGNSQTSVVAVSLDNGKIRSCKFSHSDTSINWKSPVDSGGGTMSGNLTIERSAYAGVVVKDTTQGRSGSFQYNENEELLFTNTKDSNYRTLMFLRNESNIDGLLRLSRVVDGQWTNYNVLHTGNMSSQEVAVIKKGSYTGTNVHGSNNKNSLKFNSKPKMLFVKQRNGGADFFFAMADNLIARSIHGDTQGKFYDINLSWDSDGTVTWYSTDSAYYQLNQSGNTYDYIAIL